ncbi:hypothetical protein CLU79DRAFT_695032, partial [Phycomyces nitens]
WKNNRGSEATYYHRLVTLFDHIFKHTDIKLVDCEAGHELTKSVIVLNKTMFGSYGMSPAYPRKIDLLINGGSVNTNSVVEIRSNKLKHHSVSIFIVLS